MSITRRSLLRQSGAGIAAFVTGLGPSFGQTAAPLPEISGEYGARLRLARTKAFHLHNEPADGPLHRTLLELWDRVFDRTGGSLLVTPLPNDANLPGADADAVHRVAEGAFQLVSVAAPILDRFAPDMSLQSLPYVFRSSHEVLELVGTSAFTGIAERAFAGSNFVYLPGGTFSNGMRVTTTRRERPLRILSDFASLRIRIPPSRYIGEVVTALGAVPVITGINQVRDAIATGQVDAQENPTTVIQAFRLHEVVHWINMTNHMWTGFNTLANRAFWTALPDGIKMTVLDEIASYQRLQTARQEKSNADLLEALAAQHGMEVLATDTTDAQKLMGPVYRSLYSTFSPGARALAEPLIGSYMRL